MALQVNDVVDRARYTTSTLHTGKQLKYFTTIIAKECKHKNHFHKFSNDLFEVEVEIDRCIWQVVNFSTIQNHGRRL